MSVSRTEQEQVVERFLAALTTGDVAGLLKVLAPDVLVVGDGGGLAPTIPKPVRGAAKLAPVMARFAEVNRDVRVLASGRRARAGRRERSCCRFGLDCRRAAR